MYTVAYATHVNVSAWCTVITPHTAIIYSCYMLCGHYVKYLHYRFFHCFMRKSCSIHSFSAAMQWPVHPSVIKWCLDWQPQQSQFHQIHAKQSNTTYSGNVQITLWEQTTVFSLPPSCNRYQARKKVQTSLLLISLLVSICYYYIIYYNCKTQMHEHSTIIKLLIIS